MNLLLHQRVKKYCVVLLCCLLFFNIPPTFATRRVVGVGDTLYSISRSQGVEVGDLIAWNSLPQPYTISSGQSLKLYSSGEKNEIVTPIPEDSRYSEEKKVEPAVPAADADNKKQTTQPAV